MKTPVARTQKRNGQYVMPADLMLRIKHEAADRDCFPARVVIVACEHFLSLPLDKRRRLLDSA